MTLFFWVKYIHILSSTILFGTGVGTAAVMYFGHRTNNPCVIAAINRYVVIADWVFTGSSGLIQPLTGFWLVYYAGYSLTSFWIWGSLLGYIIAGACWFPVVYLQIKMRDFAEAAYQANTNLPTIYYRYFNYWFYLGWPAFISLLIVFYLMIAKPF